MFLGQKELLLQVLQQKYLEEAKLRKDLLVEFEHKGELMRMIHTSRVMKSKNREVWGHLMRALVHEMNKRNLSLLDICNITFDLHIAKLRSPQVFSCIVQYCCHNNFTSEQYVREAGL